MDRSFLSRDDVVAAARAFVCARLLTYESLDEKKVLVDESYLGLPGPLTSVSAQPGAGLAARFIAPTADLTASRPAGDDRYRLRARLGARVPLLTPKLELDASLLAAGAPPPLTVIAPVDGGPINVPVF